MLLLKGAYVHDNKIYMALSNFLLLYVLTISNIYFRLTEEISGSGISQNFVS